VNISITCPEVKNSRLGPHTKMAECLQRCTDTSQRVLNPSTFFHIGFGKLAEFLILKTKDLGNTGTSESPTREVP
jgi:hypothetical protein